MLPDDARHGTYPGAVQHWSDSEPCCTPCRDAATRYRKRLNWDHANGRRRTLPALGAVRRLQALQRLGWSMYPIADAAGMDAAVLYQIADRKTAVHRTTYEAILRAYERLSMTIPPETTKGERISAVRARKRAERLGYPPPLAWPDDRIDDPNYQPDDWAYEAPTRAEAVDDLDESGAGISEVCRVLGIGPDSLERWCVRNGRWEQFKRIRDRERPQEAA